MSFVKLEEFFDGDSPAYIINSREDYNAAFADFNTNEVEFRGYRRVNSQPLHARWDQYPALVIFNFDRGGVHIYHECIALAEIDRARAELEKSTH
jgi:hypothetical protein